MTSIFNDVLGPVMRGPSSSHTAGPYHIGLLARSLLGEDPALATIFFDPGGSFAQVYRQQGSDQGFAAGLMGWEITDERFHQALDVAAAQGLTIRFEIRPLAPATGAIWPSSRSTCRGRAAGLSQSTLDHLAAAPLAFPVSTVGPSVWKGLPMSLFSCCVPRPNRPCVVVWRGMATRFRTMSAMVSSFSTIGITRRFHTPLLSNLDRFPVLTRSGSRRRSPMCPAANLSFGMRPALLLWQGIVTLPSGRSLSSTRERCWVFRLVP